MDIKKIYDKLEMFKQVQTIDVINTIKLELENNIDILEDVFVLDKLLFNKDKLLNLIKLEKNNNYGKINDSFKNEYGIVTNINSGYGILTYVSEYNNPYHLLECIIKCLQTRNALIIDITSNPGSNYHIVKLIQSVLKSIDCDCLLQILDNQQDILQTNGIIYIGNNKGYNDILKYNKPVIYNEYGKYILYLEDDIDIKLVNKIKKEYNEKVEIYSRINLSFEYIKVNNIEEFLDKVNRITKRYSVSIFSKNKETINILITKIYANNVLINVSPTLVDNLNISCNDLMYRKNIIRYVGESK